MTDTGFVVPATALSRLVNVYAYDAGALTLLESADDTPLRHRHPAFSGGGWATLGSDGGLGHLNLMDRFQQLAMQAIAD